MPNFTKKAIEEAFLRLLEQKPLSKIKIRDIVEECGFNRNSFYYHFADLPALVEEMVFDQLDAALKDRPVQSSVEENFTAIVNLMLSHKTAMMHIYRSVNRDIFEKYLMNACRYAVSSYFSGRLAALPISPEDRCLIERLYKCECFGVIVEWLDNDMNEDILPAIHRLCVLRDEQLTVLIRTQG